MSKVTTFFRHCPACGRRFELRVMGKDLVRNEVSTYETTRDEAEEITTPAIGGFGQVGTPYPAESPPEVKVRVSIEQKEFRYTLVCKHCGHEWFERRTVETKPTVEEERG